MEALILRNTLAIEVYLNNMSVGTYALMVGMTGGSVSSVISTTPIEHQQEDKMNIIIKPKPHRVEGSHKFGYVYTWFDTTVAQKDLIKLALNPGVVLIINTECYLEAVSYSLSTGQLDLLAKEV